VDYADLPIIDLSRTATPEGRLALAQQACDAISNHGFFYIINHGLTPAQVSKLLLSLDTKLFILEKTERMFDIADVPFASVSEEEKKIYVARMKESGSYQGYKPRQYWVNQCIFLVPNILIDHLVISTSTTAFATNWNTTIVWFLFTLVEPFLIQFSVNRDVRKRQHPEPLRPFLPEIEAFARHNHENVLHPILR